MKWYWGVRGKTPQDDMHLMADDVKVQDGCLIFLNAEQDVPTLIIANGKWSHCYAASMITGDPVTIEHWGNKSQNIDGKKERSKMTQSLRYGIMERDDFKCKICGRDNGDGVRLVIDHIIPVSKGGKTVEENLQTLCEECNQGKGAR